MTEPVLKDLENVPESDGNGHNGGSEWGKDAGRFAPRCQRLATGGEPVGGKRAARFVSRPAQDQDDRGFMSPDTTHETLQYLPDVDPELAARVLAALKRSQRRGAGHFTDQRRIPRFEYTAAVMVRTIVLLRKRGEEGEFREAAFPAYARNISQGGIGFVLAPRYVPHLATDIASILRAEDIAAVKKPLEMGLPQAEGEMRWVPGRIVRRKVIQDGFVDCGMEFEA